MSKVTETRTITSKTAHRTIMKCFKKKRPVFLWGPPGIGKSDLVASIAKEMNGLMIDLRLAQMEPTDLRGIPFYNKDINKMDWAAPVDLPDAETAKQYPVIVLFLDEMNSAPSSIQASAYQLILNRRIGKYVLPDNVVIVAAGNRESDKGVTYRMPAPLANRFIHLEMRVDHESWEDWAVRNSVHKDVIGYIGFAKQDLYDYDPRSSSRSFATPRSWVFVSELLQENDTSEEDLIELITGAIGEGPTLKFMAHRKISSDLPDPQDILSGKVKEIKIKEISAMYSLCVSLCYELKEELEKLNNKANEEFFNKLNNFIEFIMGNMTTELIVMGARIAIVTYELPVIPAKLPKFKEFHQRFGKYIVAASKR